MPGSWVYTLFTEHPIHDTLSSMETISLGGRPVAGFALGDPLPYGEIKATPVVAALAMGATASLLANLLKAPLWGAILAGAGTAVTTKFAIDRAAEIA